uniref:Igh protein n=1 Tax=Mus musculus TaxID=10090 RepID=Q91WP5_MOUSE|nr:Igh protein [Mus musculus]
MNFGLTLIFLVLTLKGVQCEVQLVESGGGLVKPGGSLKVSCAASGLTFSNYAMSWVRQSPEKRLEWVAAINSNGGNTYYSDTMKGRFTISRDNAKSTLYLQMSSLRSEDTAFYYCVRGGYFDVWGAGTAVTVSSEPAREPTIYPLTFPQALSSDPVIIGCLIHDYFPSGTMNVTWGKSGKDITTVNFPPALASGGRYTMSSQLTLPAVECPEGESVKCSVQHDSNPVQELNVNCPGICSPPTTPPPPSCQPSLSLQRPALEDLLLGSDASITCTLNGLRDPEGAVFTWEPSTGKDAVQKKAVQNSCGCYSVSSVLPGCAERWNSGASFKCTVTHPESDTLTGTIAKVTVNTFPPQVHLIPPPSEELALNELVSLTCLVRAFNPKEVLVRWLHGNEELSPESYLVFEPLKEPGEGATTYLVTSVLRVSAEIWKQGDQYSCMVGHEALPMNFTQKTIDRLSGKPTNVSVSVIMSEGDGICY